MPQPPRRAESDSAQTVFPMLAYANGPAAMDWLIRVFGFHERTRLLADDGRLAHGELSTGGPPGTRYRAEDIEGHRWMFMERAIPTH